MKSLDSILYVVEDPAIESVSAFARALSLAGNNQARLTVLHVAEEPRLGPFSSRVRIEDVMASQKQQALEQLQSLAQGIASHIDIRFDIRFGIGFIEIIRHVLRERHDLLIKRVGDGGPHSFLFGGTDQHLLRKCPCPVWIMAGETRANYRNVLAAVDFDPWAEDNLQSGIEISLNDRIVGLAASFAASDFAQLHLIHAWQPITDNIIRVFGSDISDEEASSNRHSELVEHQHQLDRLQRRLQQQLGAEAYRYLSPYFHLRQGNPRDIITAMVDELGVDLVVMGTVSRTGIPGLLIGNTAEVVLNNLECSVLAVKPTDFISPVTIE
jgi:universal stress protein E